MCLRIRKICEESDKMRYVAGSYLPAFFEMELNTVDAIDINRLKRNQWSTFLHEYIHFLQDITTTYGLYNIYVIGEYMRSATDYIKAQPLGPFEQIDFSESNQNLVQSQMDLYDATIGERDVNKRFVDTIEIKEIGESAESITKNPVTSSVQSVILHTNKGDLRFGAREIMESMAYTIQRVCYRDTPKHNEFPYMAAHQVAERYDKEFAKDPKKIVALCEMSLMTTHPGYMFITAMQELKAKNVKIKDIFAYFKSREFTNGETIGTLSIDTIYNNISHLAYRHYIGYYQGDPIFKKEVEWLERLEKFSNNHRKTTQSIFLDIMDGGEASKNSVLRHIVSIIGGPMMKNNKGHYFLFDNTPNLSVIAATKSIYYDVFVNGENKCGLYGWCKQSPTNDIDENCPYKPWNRCESPDTMCPFSILWRKWGLSGHYPD